MLKKLVFCLLFLSSITAASTLKRELDGLIERQGDRALIGVVVQDAKSSEILYAHHSELAFTPASNTKLFTAAAALYDLGPDFQYHTQLFVSGYNKRQGAAKDVILKLSGDPSLTTNSIHKLLARLKKYKIQKITGRVIIEAHHVDKPYWAPGLSYDDMVWGYGAPVSGVVIDENAFNVKFIPSKKLHGPVSLEVNSAIPLKIKNKLYTVTKAQQKNCHLIIETNAQNHLSFQGCWPMEKTSVRELAIKYPAQYLKDFMHIELSRLGITHRSIVTGRHRSKVKLIGHIDSPPLIDLIHKMLKESDNLYADSLIKTMGYRHFKHGNYKSGSRAMRNTLKRISDLDFSRSVIIDGAGDSRYNLITPRQIVRLLYVIHHGEYAKRFLKALPDAGRDGTLKSRMTSFDLKDHVFAKTGTMSGVSNLSGYIITKDKRTLIFSIMMNHLLSSPDKPQAIYDARQLQADMATIIAHYQR